MTLEVDVATQDLVDQGPEAEIEVADPECAASQRSAANRVQFRSAGRVAANVIAHRREAQRLHDLLFDVEEQIMQALGFPAMRDHIRRHAASTAELNTVCRGSLGRGTLRISDLDLCFRTLIDEILRGDIDLKSHFQSMDGMRPIEQRGA